MGTSTQSPSLVAPRRPARLHPLSVEDALRATTSPRSKLDFYKTHLYLQILIQHTHPSDEAILSAAADEMGQLHLREEFSGSQRKLLTLPEGVEGVFEPSVGGTRLQGGRSVRRSASQPVFELKCGRSRIIRRHIG
jgi:hypothetical protein